MHICAGRAAVGRAYATSLASASQAPDFKDGEIGPSIGAPPKTIAPVIGAMRAATLTHTVIHSRCEHFAEPSRMNDLGAQAAG